MWRISKESAYLETGKLLGEEGLPLYRYGISRPHCATADAEEKTGELATLIAELESVLPLENAVESKDEPFHATYLIGDNLVLAAMRPERVRKRRCHSNSFVSSVTQADTGFVIVFLM